jgi:hypothetical protein
MLLLFALQAMRNAATSKDAPNDKLRLESLDESDVADTGSISDKSNEEEDPTILVDNNEHETCIGT